MRIGFKSVLVLFICTLVGVASASAQSRRSVRTSEEGGTILNVTAWRTAGADPIRLENLFLYENSIEQKIKNLTYDASPARIVLLVDNSQTVRPTVEQLQAAVKEFSYEIFEGDELFVIAYDEKPEIIQEWTDDAKKIEASISTFRKQGNPHLFDALDAARREVLLPLMPGTRKTAVVIIGDGLDRGSSTQFDKLLADLQSDNITVYALQIPDRTGGAYRRNQPKPAQVIKQLTEESGGKTFDFEETPAAAKAICDELRKNRYLLSYQPANSSSYDARRVFIVADEGIAVRTKTAHPPNVK